MGPLPAAPVQSVWALPGTPTTRPALSYVDGIPVVTRGQTSAQLRLREGPIPTGDKS